ncbi:MAG TPA: patatin-like phospholipase family protein [Chloroflexi bacterium]|nr:patatin-like phospholipase family protein [Chloroflexota bacterium]
MIAFVLSGGGNYGAMQAGALAALAERGIKADMIIGTSVGALNGAIAAYDASADGMANLGQLWRSLSSDLLYPGGYPVALVRVARGKPSLFSNRGIRAFLRQHLPDNAKTFGDLTAARLYVIATEIPNGQVRIFGEDPSENLKDALLASAALPPLHPPYQIGDKLYVDGSLATKFPLKIAIEKGASTIYALHIYHNPAEQPYDNSIVSLSRWSIAKLLHDLDERELAWSKEHTTLKLHYLQLKPEFTLAATDFNHSAEMLESGYNLTIDYLNNLPLPLKARLNQEWHKFKTRITKSQSGPAGEQVSG